MSLSSIYKKYYAHIQKNLLLPDFLGKKSDLDKMTKLIGKIPSVESHGDVVCLHVHPHSYVMEAECVMGHGSGSKKIFLFFLNIPE